MHIRLRSALVGGVLLLIGACGPPDTLVRPPSAVKTPLPTVLPLDEASEGDFTRYEITSWNVARPVWPEWQAWVVASGVGPKREAELACYLGYGDARLVRTDLPLTTQKDGQFSFRGVAQFLGKPRCDESAGVYCRRMRTDEVIPD